MAFDQHQAPQWQAFVFQRFFAGLQRGLFLHSETSPPKQRRLSFFFIYLSCRGGPSQ
jgi:hypothetical protein